MRCKPVAEPRLLSLVICFHHVTIQSRDGQRSFKQKCIQERII